MAEASRGGFTVRAMLSLEPATISGRKYPELFQTGETAFGKQLIDAQHPHDFFMELAAQYRYRNAYLYVAPVGEPALGPVAFMHRDSATELPQSPIGHHYEDSTHIAFNVVTAGFDAGPATFEASVFHGGEPDEHRWDIDGGRIDSWSARIRLQPAPNLDLQLSHGRLSKPEAIEPGYATRSTASISYNLPLPFGRWTSTICRAQVYKEVHDRTLNAWLGESALHLGHRSHLIVRAEQVDKDEIFPHPILTKVPKPPLPVRVFRIEAFTYGYTFDVARGIGVGANVTTYRFPAVLQGFYSPKPHAVLVFTRARL
jgi:hypothetical protein